MEIHECKVSELDLFSPQPLQASVLKSEDIIFNPVTAIDNSNVIEFNINGASDYYRDLSNIHLRLRVQLLKPDNSAYKEDKEANPKVDEKKDQPGFVNMALFSVFKSCSVYMNNKLVSHSDNFHYKNYIEKILNFDKQCIDTKLVNEGFVKDDHGPSFDKVDDTNLGLKARREFVYNSSIYEVMGRLSIDCFNLSKLFINNIDIKIVFTLESPSFFIMEKSSNGTKFKLHEAQLVVPHKTINPNILLEHHETLIKGSLAKYGFKRNEIKTYTIASGQRTINLDNVFTGVLPTNIVIGLVDNSAYTGHVEKNPYYFHNYTVQSIGVFVNGQSIPQTPLTTDFKNNLYARAYAQFYAGCGKLNNEQTTSVTRLEFKRGYFLLPFVLAPTQSFSEVDCIDLLNEGALRLELKLEDALPTTISLLVYAEYSAQLQVDKNYNVSVIG